MIIRYDWDGEGMYRSSNGDYIDYDDYVTLEDRVAELESRLEIEPAHNVDGIDARNATIELQDAAIDELKARVAELKKDAARYRWLRDYCGWTMITEDSRVRIHINLPLERPEAFWDVDEFDAAIDAAMQSGHSKEVGS